MKTFRQFLKEQTEHPMLSLDPHTFDQSERGWRSLPREEQPGVLSSYIKKHVDNQSFRDTAPKMKNGAFVSPSTLHFHLGQTHAMSGNNKEAIDHIKKSVTPDDNDWNSYANATASFLQNDRKSFEKHAIGVQSNKDTIDRLRKNFGKSYSEAY